MRGLVIVVLMLAACEQMNAKPGRMADPANNGPGHIDVTLVSLCPKPVELCYGAQEKCITLVDAKPKLVRADTGGGTQVLVNIKSGEAHAFADETFNQIEVALSCTRLERRIGAAVESTAATAGGPAR